MIEIFDVEKFIPLKIVHDSIVSTFELHDNMFIMTFDRVDLESETMEIVWIKKNGWVKFFQWQNDKEFIDDMLWVKNCLLDLCKET